jgi:hypothetical protein
MRTDLPSMNAGKAMAQASHASNAFLHDSKKIKEGGREREDWDQLANRIIEWEEQTEQGFGTVLVMGTTLPEIESFTQDWMSELPSYKNETMFYEVKDPTYPYFVNSEILPLIEKGVHTMAPVEKDDGYHVCFRNEITCAYFFADKSCPVTVKLTERFELHK